MPTVFIAGSISISRLHEKVQERINKIVSSNLRVVVGDAEGADTSIQQCLQKYQARDVTVYCTGYEPRNNVAKWPVHHVQTQARTGSRAYFTAKDLEMARSSDFGLMIWDCKSTGTLSNVIELLKENKKSVVFVNKSSRFLNITDSRGLTELVCLMSEHARSKAEEKIGLSAKIAELKQEQLAFDNVHDDPDSLLSTRVPLVDRDDVAALTSSDDSTPVIRNGNLKLRSELLAALRDHVSRVPMSTPQAASTFGVTQTRISDLTMGDVDRFDLEALVEMAYAAGLEIEMRVKNNSAQRWEGEHRP